MAIRIPKVEDILKNKYLVTELKRFATETRTLDSYNFLTEKSDNKTLYTKYILPSSKTQVNLPGKIQGALDALAKTKKWSDMNSGIKDARDDVAQMLDMNIMQQKSSKPYLVEAAAIGQMDVDNPAVAVKVKPLLKAYLAKATPQEQFTAYKEMQKIVPKSKLDPVLRLLDEPPPAPPPVPEVEEKMAGLKREIAEGLRYFKAAEENLDKKGVPANNPVLITRMFQSGRMRHDKAHEPYVEGIKLDSDFKTRYKTVVDDKKDLDEAWAAYRKRLGK